MEENKQTTKKSKGKKIAKNIAKVGLTIASPPFGLMSFFKEGRSFAFVVGIVISAMGSVGINEFNKDVLYDKLKVSLERRAYNLPRNVFETFMSPIASYLDTYPSTKIGTNVVYGQDVINFNSDEGKYELDFKENRMFEYGKGLVSVTEAEDEILKSRKKQDDLIAEGNISDARENRYELKMAKSRHEWVSKGYSAKRKIYENAVSEMNSELEILSNSNQ